MQPHDLIEKIDHLLRKPLSSRHINYLRWARKKVQEADLVEFDRDYIFYLWDEFGPSAATEISQQRDIRSADNSLVVGLEAKPEPRVKRIESTDIPAATETELEKAKTTIAQLRDAGKRAVAQRDRLEAVVKSLEKKLAAMETELEESKKKIGWLRNLEKEVADLRRKNAKPDQKFEEAKRAFAKLYHPNASVSKSPLETMVRSEIFKEFWGQIERIDSQN